MTYAAASTPSEAVRQLIAGGESATVEFKSSFKFDVATRSGNKELPKVVAKTLCGFLNAAGGNLLIGVADDGAVLGLESDLALISSRNTDGLERAIRTALANHLGVEISPHVDVGFVDINGLLVAHVRCNKHHQPVFLRDGDAQRFYVRDGNQTKPLDIGNAHTYINGHWPPVAEIDDAQLRAIVVEAVAAATASPVSAPSPPEIPSQIAERAPGVAPMDPSPPWLRMASHRVLQLFLEPLARSHGWKRIYIVSPWLSLFDTGASMTFTQMLKRITDDGATVYVVTRPPETAWHTEAVTLMAETTRANIVQVPHLHVKLYAARTLTGSFAVFGSANFTQAALDANRELAVRVDGFAGGRRVLANLELEAANIYRTPGRQFIARAKF